MFANVVPDVQYWFQCAKAATLRTCGVAVPAAFYAFCSTLSGSSPGLLPVGYRRRPTCFAYPHHRRTCGLHGWLVTTLSPDSTASRLPFLSTPFLAEPVAFTPHFVQTFSRHSNLLCSCLLPFSAGNNTQPSTCSSATLPPLALAGPRPTVRAVADSPRQNISYSSGPSCA